MLSLVAPPSLSLAPWFYSTAANKTNVIRKCRSKWIVFFYLQLYLSPGISKIYVNLIDLFRFQCKNDSITVNGYKSFALAGNGKLSSRCDSIALCDLLNRFIPYIAFGFNFNLFFSFLLYFDCVIHLMGLWHIPIFLSSSPVQCGNR